MRSRSASKRLAMALSGHHGPSVSRDDDSLTSGPFTGPSGVAISVRVDMRAARHHEQTIFAGAPVVRGHVDADGGRFRPVVRPGADRVGDGFQQERRRRIGEVLERHADDVFGNRRVGLIAVVPHQLIGLGDSVGLEPVGRRGNLCDVACSPRRTSKDPGPCAASEAPMSARW